jgi:DMSO/TMAO reductase YedYZ molybdopterin-dependent catalytic subunit
VTTSVEPGRARRPGWLPVLVVACLASAAALLLQNVLRDTWQIRTLPERVMEWFLLFVPLDLFERGVQTFGGDAKVLTLQVTVAGMGAVLVALGVVGLRSGWSSWRLLGLGVGLWLFAMVVVMPVTGAGFFATSLLISPLLTSVGYLTVFLSFACVLIFGRLLVSRNVEHHPALNSERRALLAGLVGTIVAGGVARLIGQGGGQVGSALPLAAAPTPAQAPTPPAPAGTPGSGANGTPVAAQTGPTPVAGPGAAATPTLVPLPNPPPPKHLTRDSDGSLTAAGRPKGELAPPITSNDDFYIVTKNANGDPIVDAETWRLVIDGEVNRPVQVDYRTMSAMPSVEVTKTLECISNFTAGCSLTSFGCDLISTARWKGVRLSDLIDLAGGLKPTAVGLAFLATDEFTAGLTTDIVADPETLVVYEMNGVPLPREHGFPARLLVPGRYGMKNPKWLAGIRAMTQEYQGWYEQRGWNKVGIIKTMSRIDVPIDGSMLTAGDQRVAGVSYAGDRGVSRVDFSLDDGGTWLPTQFLEPMPDTDTMVRWEATFTLPEHSTVTITIRATDGTGEMQTDDFQLPQPDGASGRDQVTVTAA